MTEQRLPVPNYYPENGDRLRDYKTQDNDNVHCWFVANDVILGVVNGELIAALAERSQERKSSESGRCRILSHTYRDFFADGKLHPLNMVEAWYSVCCEAIKMAREHSKYEETAERIQVFLESEKKRIELIYNALNYQDVSVNSSEAIFQEIYKKPTVNVLLGRFFDPSSDQTWMVQKESFSVTPYSFTIRFMDNKIIAYVERTRYDEWNLYKIGKTIINKNFDNFKEALHYSINALIEAYRHEISGHELIAVYEIFGKSIHELRSLDDPERLIIPHIITT